MRKTFTFDDVLITPRFSTIASRKECDTTTKLGICNFLSLSLPIISSNMDTVTEANMANSMSEAGGIGALHRFCSIEENVEMFMKSPANTLVSVGVGEKELERAQALYNVGARNFIIDVANGASLQVVKQYKELRIIIGRFSHVMVGNFATKESIVQFVNNLKGSQVPDSFKVGIGGGSMCTTRIVTGCGILTLSSVMDCCSLIGYNIVADGGIRNSGDIAKCLAVGAKAVMIGNLLAGTDESPGEIVRFDNFGISMTEEEWQKLIEGDNNLRQDNKFKKYRGSASKESYEVQGKIASHRAPEGDSTLVPYKGSVAPILEQLKAGIQSAMSYVDAMDLNEFRENAELVEVSSNSVVENGSHGKR